MGVGDILDRATAALSRQGLILRGGFDFRPGETAPEGPSGLPARAVLLIGHAGASHWPHFRRWRDARPDNIATPLDTWSRAVIASVAESVGARVLMPGDRPYAPFQQWAMRAEGLRPSPLGILMHPEYGLWHAYRGALLFDQALGLEPAGPMAHPCDACAEKPCLKSCPVGAYSGERFDYAGCLAHVRGLAGAACMSGGCLDRNACPVGRTWRYPAAMQAFHMAAYAR